MDSAGSRTRPPIPLHRNTCSARGVACAVQVKPPIILMDAITALGDRVIAYRPVLRAMGVASTVSGALLASQLLWEYQRAGRKPFAVTDAELAAATSMTVNEIRTARADIVGSGFFGYSRTGMPAVGTYTVDSARFNGLSSKPIAAQLFGLQHEQVRATARTSSGESTNKFGPQHEQSIYKDSLERSLERKEKSNAPAAPFDSVAVAPVPKSKRVTSATDPLSRKLLPSDAVPDDLKAVKDLIVEFWAAKKGTRSGPVLNRICKRLRGWPPPDRVTALEAAITNGWGDVFEPRKPQPFNRGREPDPGPPLPRPFVRKVLPIDPETGLPDPFADMPYTPKIP